MTEILAVIVGAILGYGAGWVQARVDRRRRRIALASAMLLEARRTERNLREIATSERAALASAELPLGAHRRASQEADLFRSTTSAAIFDFMTAVDDVQHGMTLLASGQAQATEQRTWEQRARATFAANRVNAVKEALLAEGGKVERERNLGLELTYYPQLPTLEPSAFPQPSRD